MQATGVPIISDNVLPCPCKIDVHLGHRASVQPGTKQDAEPKSKHQSHLSLATIRMVTFYNPMGAADDIDTIEFIAKFDFPIR